MSLVTNYFPSPIPYDDYTICRSVCYDPEIPLTMTWWRDEGWNGQTDSETDWESERQKRQPQHWTHNGEPEQQLNRWGELINPATGRTFWDEKHRTPPVTGASHSHSSKGEHMHDECPGGRHYHDVYLPRKMYRIQPGDRVLVAWVGTNNDEDHEAVVVDVVMKATEMV